MQVVVDLVAELTHLGDLITGVTLCGVAIGATWGARKYFMINQVGCKDCKKELTERTKDKK